MKAINLRQYAAIAALVISYAAFAGNPTAIFVNDVSVGDNESGGLPNSWTYDEDTRTLTLDSEEGEYTISGRNDDGFFHILIKKAKRVDLACLTINSSDGRPCVVSECTTPIYARQWCQLFARSELAIDAAGATLIVYNDASFEANQTPGSSPGVSVARLDVNRGASFKAAFVNAQTLFRVNSNAEKVEVYGRIRSTAFYESLGDACSLASINAKKVEIGGGEVYAEHGGISADAVSITGGKVIARCPAFCFETGDGDEMDYLGAAIGPGMRCTSASQIQNIQISGGTVFAQSDVGCGIGTSLLATRLPGGKDIYGKCKTLGIRISGGKVEAFGGTTFAAPAIGTCRYASVALMIEDPAEVMAMGGSSETGGKSSTVPAPGIGTCRGEGGTVEIRGGTVSAYGNRGPGIGRSSASDGDIDIKVSGGEVYARGGADSPGIEISSGVEVSGGTVWALGNPVNMKNIYDIGALQGGKCDPFKLAGGNVLVYHNTGMMLDDQGNACTFLELRPDDSGSGGWYLPCSMVGVARLPAKVFYGKDYGTLIGWTGDNGVRYDGEMLLFKQGLDENRPSVLTARWSDK